MTDLPDLGILADATIRTAMEKLDATAKKCLFVVDTERTLVGTLTDGDVRRAILQGAGLESTISTNYNPRPHSIVESATADAQAISMMKEYLIEVVPIVDDAGTLIRYVTWDKHIGPIHRALVEPANVPVVVMAGGMGKRLEPFTTVLPKPLIPVRDKPIIEHIIDKFLEYGLEDFWLTVNYKSGILKAYFAELQPEYSVRFVDESEPMGTAGSLQFLQNQIDQTFFVTNCDIIVDADYSTLMKFHRENGHAITLVGSAISYRIPYGTCVLNNDGALEAINEKPAYDFIVNTGLYVVEPSILSLIPKQGKYHMTDLMSDAMARGQTVGVFPVSENAWIDVGQWKEFQKAVTRL